MVLPRPGSVFDRFWRFYFRRSRLRVRLGELLIALLVAEMAARHLVGLGTPPLFLAHPTIEYLQRPDQDIHRFGRHFLVNHWGMRSAPFPARKRAPDEYRVMVFGDSVVNGGAVTAHESLATTRLGQLLAAELGRPVTVGNVSCGSWGPGNWLAYARAYGLFEADLVLLVLSSHDAIDTPTYGPLPANAYPVQAPILALEEGLYRYLERFVPASLQVWKVDEPPPPPEPSEDDLRIAHRQAMADLTAFIELVRASGADFHALLHATRTEAEPRASDESNWDLGRRELKAFFAAQRTLLTDLQPVWHQALAEGIEPFRDTIHLNDRGQDKLLQALMAAALAPDRSRRNPAPSP